MKIGEPNLIIEAISLESTTLHLTPEQIELFKLFRQYQEPFKVLIESGVFDTKKGTATLSFDNHGLLTDVSVTFNAYKRKGYQQE